MSKYSETIEQLRTAVETISVYQDNAKIIAQSMGDIASSSNEEIINQTLRLEEIKNETIENIERYTKKINEVSNDITAGIKTELDTKLESLKQSINEELDKTLVLINDKFEEVYGNLNEDRLSLITKLEESLAIQKQEKIISKNIDENINEQNKHLHDINLQLKENIKENQETTKLITEELELLKENFELKYVYNKKRIMYTSIFSLSMLIMIAATIFTSIFMFSYYFKLIFFPSRLYTLFLGILTILLGIGLIILLVVVLIKPPTFIKVRKVKKGLKNEKK